MRNCFVAVVLLIRVSVPLVGARGPETPSTTTLFRPAKSKTEPRRDRCGDPLPPGAIARLGTLRFRVPGEVEELAFAPDGKTVAVSSDAGVFLLDVASGKRIKELS